MRLSVSSRAKFAVATLAVATALLSVWLWWSHVPLVDTPLPDSIYVWQRSWTTAVVAAIESTSGADRWLVLAAEIEKGFAGLRPVFVAYHADALRSSRSVTLVVRLGAIGELASAKTTIRRSVIEALSRAREKNLSVECVQLDFDAAERQLSEYAAVLRDMRSALGGVRLSVTALMSWTDRASFAEIAAAVDEYTLQLHDLPADAGVVAGRHLFDRARADRAILRAARIGRPFTVALPTHRYDVRSKADATIRWRIGADPAELAGFVRSLRRRHPKCLVGITWFRLPVAGESLNASAAEFAALREGRVPTAQIRLEWIDRSAGLRDLMLTNAGDGDGAPPTSIEMTGSILAADVVGGYHATRLRNGLRLSSAASIMDPVRPGERRIVAWVRTEHGSEVHVATSFPSPP